jgi:hypothetical protein
MTWCLRPRHTLLSAGLGSPTASSSVYNRILKQTLNKIANQSDFEGLGVHTGIPAWAFQLQVRRPIILLRAEVPIIMRLQDMPPQAPEAHYNHTVTAMATTYAYVLNTTGTRLRAGQGQGQAGREAALQLWSPALFIIGTYAAPTQHIGGLPVKQVRRNRGSHSSLNLVSLVIWCRFAGQT